MCNKQLSYIVYSEFTEIPVTLCIIGGVYSLHSPASPIIRTEIIIQTITHMKMKKIYAVPALEILEFESENLLTGSNTSTDVKISNSVTQDDAKMTNKNNSWNHTWE